MKNTSTMIAITILMLTAATAAFAQFPKLPKVKDIVPKTTGPATVGSTAGQGGTQTTASNNPTAASTEASILRRTLNVKPRRFGRWWRNPAAAEPVYDTFCWAPEIEFSIYGPVASGSQIYVEWDKADGTPWFTQRMSTPTLAADYYDEVKHVEDLSFDALEKKAITTPAGIFPFRIKLKNALAGTEQLLFAGKYRMENYIPDQKIPEYKGKKDFYSNEDWRIPMAWLWLNPIKNEDAPILNAQMWFKASENSDKFEAFLFYGGKQILASLAMSADETLNNGDDARQNRYSLRTFYFSTVRGFNKAAYPEQYQSSFFQDKNPGEYEIKVLRNGELSRSFKFNVSPEGKVVDNGIAKNNKVGGMRWIIPQKIHGSADGTWNKSAWNTDAFYGNPLNGFTALQ
jgi:hypothetical protein